MRDVVVVAVAWAAVTAGAAASVAAAPDVPIRVLFIGNSYTHANDLPGMVVALSAAGGRRIVTGMEAPGGCTLERHVREGRAARAIAAGPWDVVVLQEQSMLPVVDPARMIDWGAKLDALVRERGGRTLLFQTWARAGRPDMQPPLTAAYDAFADRCAAGRDGDGGAAVVPVGEAWRRALAADQPPALHVADGSHPTPAGTYVAACTFYAVLHGLSPVGLPGRPAGLDDAAARPLQQAAWEAAQARAAGPAAPSQPGAERAP